MNWNVRTSSGTSGGRDSKMSGGSNGVHDCPLYTGSALGFLGTKRGTRSSWTAASSRAPSHRSNTHPTKTLCARQSTGSAIAQPRNSATDNRQNLRSTSPTLYLEYSSWFQDSTCHGTKRQPARKGRSTFDAGVHDISGLGPKGPIRFLLRELGIEKTLEFKRVTSEYIFPNIRFQVPHDWKDFVNLLPERWRYD